jgi:hypothetical protein
MVMPPEENPDDVLAAMEEHFKDLVEPEVENLMALTDYELSIRFNDARDTLMTRNEMDKQTTDAGRHWQSIRAACLIEMRRREKRV